MSLQASCGKCGAYIDRLGYCDRCAMRYRREVEGCAAHVDPRDDRIATPTFPVALAAPRFAPYAGTMAGIVRLGEHWYGFNEGEIDMRNPFTDKLEALDWLRVKVREAEILAKRSRDSEAAGVRQ